MTEPLSLGLMDAEAVASLIGRRSHWVFVFGRGCEDHIDTLDAAIDHFPTYPTVVGPPWPMTFVPKAEVKPERFIEWMKGAAAAVDIEELRAGRDIIFVTPDPLEAVEMGGYLQSLISDAPTGGHVDWT